MGYAIVTRYHGPTNYRGSRIIATGPRARTDAPMTRATIGYQAAEIAAGSTRRASHAIDPHRVAADLVAAKLRADGWHVTVSDGACLPDDNGYVFPLRYVTDAERSCPHYDPAAGACSHTIAAEMIGAAHA